MSPMPYAYKALYYDQLTYVFHRCPVRVVVALTVARWQLSPPPVHHLASSRDTEECKALNMNVCLCIVSLCVCMHDMYDYDETFGL